MGSSVSMVRPGQPARPEQARPAPREMTPPFRVPLALRAKRGPREQVRQVRRARLAQRVPPDPRVPVRLVRPGQIQTCPGQPVRLASPEQPARPARVKPAPRGPTRPSPVPLAARVPQVRTRPSLARKGTLVRQARPGKPVRGPLARPGKPATRGQRVQIPPFPAQRATRDRLVPANRDPRAQRVPVVAQPVRRAIPGQQATRGRPAQRAIPVQPGLIQQWPDPRVQPVPPGRPAQEKQARQGPTRLCPDRPAQRATREVRDRQVQPAPLAPIR
jgi:hypothetical protein